MWINYKSSFTDANPKACLIFQLHFLLFKLQSSTLNQFLYSQHDQYAEYHRIQYSSYTLKPTDLQFYQYFSYIYNSL